MIELTLPGGPLRLFRYRLTPDVLATGVYELPDLSALLSQGVQVVPVYYLLANKSNANMEFPRLVLNGSAMNLGTPITVDRCIVYHCTGDSPPDFPEWNTGGAISMTWGAWSGDSGAVLMWLYVNLIPLSTFV